MSDAQRLMEKIQALPPERIAEVEDFVEFLAAREQDRALARAVTFASERSFAKVSDNSEDDVYDAL